MQPIAICGASGFGREVACTIQLINKESPTWDFVGFFDDGMAKGTEVQYGKILGGIEDLNEWKTPLSVCFAIGNPKALKSLVGKISNPNVDFPNIIAPNVLFLDRDTVKMGMGNVICANSLVSCNVKLGNFNMLNVYAHLGHESEVGDFNVIMPDASISGGVVVGDANLFGAKSVVLQYKKVGNEVVLAPGSVLSRTAKDGRTYLGNPAKLFV